MQRTIEIITDDVTKKEIVRGKSKREIADKIEKKFPELKFELEDQAKRGQKFIGYGVTKTVVARDM